MVIKKAMTIINRKMTSERNEMTMSNWKLSGEQVESEAGMVQVLL
jgi:hypothetical protein